MEPHIHDPFTLLVRFMYPPHRVGESSAIELVKRRSLVHYLLINLSSEKVLTFLLRDECNYISF